MMLRCPICLSPYLKANANRMLANGFYEEQVADLLNITVLEVFLHSRELTRQYVDMIGKSLTRLDAAIAKQPAEHNLNIMLTPGSRSFRFDNEGWIVDIDIRIAKKEVSRYECTDPCRQAEPALCEDADRGR